MNETTEFKEGDKVKLKESIYLVMIDREEYMLKSLSELSSLEPKRLYLKKGTIMTCFEPGKICCDATFRGGGRETSLNIRWLDEQYGIKEVGPILSSDKEKQNWIKFGHYRKLASHGGKKHIIQEQEINKVIDTITSIVDNLKEYGQSGDFTYRNLLEVSNMQPVILKRVISILRKRGVILKVSRRYWRMKEDS